MKKRIQANLERGIYIKCGTPNALCPSYFNTERGWINHLIGGMISFSHRQNDYENYEYPYALEYHDNYELIIYHTGEDLQYIADGQYLTMPQHTALLIKPYTMHMLRLPSQIPCERYVINFKSLDILFPDTSALGFLESGSSNCALFYDDRYDYVSLCEALEAALSDADSPFQNARAIMRITELFLALSDSRQLENREQGQIGDNVSVPEKLLRIKECIDNEFATVGSASELADRFHYNREYLTRSFKKHFGISVYEYILRRRLMYARSLILTGESALNTAQRCGFKNYSNFVKRFVKHFGYTPSECKNKKQC